MFCHRHSKTNVSGNEKFARDIQSASALLISNQMGSHNAASLLDSLRHSGCETRQPRIFTTTSCR